MNPRVRIVSDGTPKGTKVYVDGVDISGTVTRVEWTLGSRKEIALVRLDLVGTEVEVDVEGEAELEGDEVIEGTPLPLTYQGEHIGTVTSLTEDADGLVFTADIDPAHIHKIAGAAVVSHSLLFDDTHAALTLSRRQRFHSWRSDLIWRTRTRLASCVAGYDITEGNDW